MNRRTFLTTAALAGAASVVPAAPTSGKRLGITLWSYNIRWRNRTTPISGQPAWRDALDVLEHCKELGAGCLQIGVRGWSQDFANRVRDQRESFGIHLEGQIGLPHKDADLSRFEADLRAAREAGATVLRTVCLGGRRYESFQTLEDWNRFALLSRESLERAEPVLRKHKLKLAIENHKDWRIDEQLDLLKHFDSEWIGVNLDFGNNFALLEHPHEVAEALAPYVMTTHIKDMALAEYEDGFLLSEVPLGEGVLNLRRMMDLCEAKNPQVQFNLEMITRDPLRVPVLKGHYHATLPNLPARELIDTLTLARRGEAARLPTIARMSAAEQIAIEERYNRQSFEHARMNLQLA